MTEAEYGAGRDRATRVIVGLGYSRAVAEDAVQAAALYFLEHTYLRVTPSLFTQRAVQRAAHIQEAAYGSDRPHGKTRLVVHIGGSDDLANFETGSPVCTSDGDENN